MLPDCTWVVRSRFVAMEVAYEVRYDTFAGTPPLKAIKILLSLAASTQSDDGKYRHQIGLHDCSVAFFHADMDELIYVIPPPGEDNPNVGWKLIKALYGICRASLLLGDFTANTMMEHGSFRRIPIAAQSFHQPEWKVTTLVHGDDFISDGDSAGLDKLDSLLRQYFEIKVLPRVGPGASAEGSFLKRLITWTASGFAWKADPAHASKLVQILSKKPAASLVSPGSKAVGKACREKADLLSTADAKTCRSLAATALYISADRMDIQFAVKVLLISMSEPPVIDWLRLERVARYLASTPRLQILFNYQPMYSIVFLCNHRWLLAFLAFA